MDYSGCNLTFAYLRGTNLSGANLSGAELTHADFGFANLTDADLSSAELTHANLEAADLSGANLTGVDLTNANLRRADLSGANLSGVNLSNKNLSGVILTGVILRDTQGIAIENLRDYTFDLSTSDRAPAVDYGVTAFLGRNGVLTSYLVFDIPSGSTFADGTTTVTAQVIDAAGNVAAQTTFDVIVNRSPPEPPVTTLPEDITAPTVQMMGLPELFMAQPALSATIALFEAITGFDISEL